MAKVKPKGRSPRVAYTINRLKVLTERIQDLQDLSAIDKSFAQVDSWVVYAPGDKFGHYATLLGNLTGHAPSVQEPTFHFLRSFVKEGLPRSAFERVKSVLAISTDQLSLTTEISARTVSRRQRFRPDESERLLRVASAFQKALELFEDIEKARKWFTTPKSALDGMTPLECCDTEAGSNEVENLIGRIDEGVYS